MSRMPSRPARSLIARSSVRAACSLAVALGLLLMVGCSSFTTYRTARPVPKGRTQTLVAPQMSGAGPRETQKAPFPELAVSVRHGLTHKLELGGTLTVLPLGQAMRELGVEATAKRHVLASAGGRWDVAVAGGLGYRTFASSGALFEMVHASIPLIVGVNLGDDQIVIAPTLAWQRWYATGAHPVDIPSFGASLGYRWQISPRFALLPEISGATSPTAMSGFGETGLVHLGIALVFGRN